VCRPARLLRTHDLPDAHHVVQLLAGAPGIRRPVLAHQQRHGPAISLAGIINVQRIVRSIVYALLAEVAVGSLSGCDQVAMRRPSVQDLAGTYRLTKKSQEFLEQRKGYALAPTCEIELGPGSAVVIRNLPDCASNGFGKSDNKVSVRCRQVGTHEGVPRLRGSVRHREGRNSRVGTVECSPRPEAALRT
jgi:hypothetical protein